MWVLRVRVGGHRASGVVARRVDVVLKACAPTSTNVSRAHELDPKARPMGGAHERSPRMGHAHTPTLVYRHDSSGKSPEDTFARPRGLQARRSKNEDKYALRAKRAEENLTSFSASAQKKIWQVLAREARRRKFDKF